MAIFSSGTSPGIFSEKGIVFQEKILPPITLTVIMHTMVTDA
jgi:hypothetical protein